MNILSVSEINQSNKPCSCEAKQKAFVVSFYGKAEYLRSHYFSNALHDVQKSFICCTGCFIENVNAFFLKIPEVNCNIKDQPALCYFFENCLQNSDLLG